MEHDNKDPRSKVYTLNIFNSTAMSTDEKRDNSKDDEYNPFEHRNISHANSEIGALAHLLKSSLGTGILAMPMAYKNSGLLIGAVGTIFIGFICTHCVHIFVKTSQDVCRRSKIPSLGYTETAEKVFEMGPHGTRKYAPFVRKACDFGMVSICMSINCVYIVFIATSFQSVINYELRVNWDVRYYIAVTVIPCIIIGEIRKLKHLVPFSVIANLCIAITFAITLWFILTGPLEIVERPLFSSWSQLPLFFSTVIFALDGINAVMPVENSMKNPHKFLGCTGVLNTSMITATILYGSIGLLGYVRYGDDVEASVTLNLPEGILVAKAAQILIAIAVLFTFGLKFYAPMDILWRKIKPNVPKHKQSIYQSAFRAGCVLMMGCVAAAVPLLDPFISLIGAVFTSFLSLFIPAVVETIFRYPDNLGFGNWILIKNGLVIVFAVLSLVTGSFFSLKEILLSYM